MEIPKSCVVFNIGKTYRAVVKPFDTAFAAIGITPMQFGLLVHVSLLQPASAVEISQATGHDPSTLSRTLAGLMEKGWIRGEQNSVGDKRKRIYSMLPSGKEVLEQAIPVWQETHDMLVAALGAEDWDGTKESLLKLASAVDQ